MNVEKKHKLGKELSWVIAVLALIYDFSAVDILPDPIVGIGGLDDILITLFAIFNLIQHNTGDNKPNTKRIAKKLKWGCASFTIITILVLALSIYGLIKLFN